MNQIKHESNHKQVRLIIPLDYSDIPRIQILYLILSSHAITTDFSVTFSKIGQIACIDEYIYR